MDRRSGLIGIGSLAAAALFGRAIGSSRAAPSDYMPAQGFPYAAFDGLPSVPMTVGGGTIHIAFAPGQIAPKRAAIMDWIRRAATSVTTYYGHFPVPAVRLLVAPVEGGGVQGGTTWGYRGAAIRMLVGSDCDIAELDHDWMMTHEMVHTALPDMPERYNWLAEGLAVYIEPIARVQAGFLTPRAIWADNMRDMPNGLPRVGDRGLDNTPTWGRIYWGGALYCLLCDLDIRKATHNRHGLQDAMRGLLAAGGNRNVAWPIEEILRVADEAVGVRVMRDLYARMRAEPATVDLPALWSSMGLVATDDGLTLRDDAPLAAERLAITVRETAG